jgi:hypothetical protein
VALSQLKRGPLFAVTLYVAAGREQRDGSAVFRVAWLPVARQKQTVLYATLARTTAYCNTIQKRRYGWTTEYTHSGINLTACEGATVRQRAMRGGKHALNPQKAKVRPKKAKRSYSTDGEATPSDDELVASAGLAGPRRHHPRVLCDTFRPHVARVVPPTPPLPTAALATETRLFIDRALCDQCCAILSVEHLPKMATRYQR